MVFHVAGAKALHRGGRELSQQLEQRLRADVDQGVQTATMRHTYHDGLRPCGKPFAVIVPRPALNEENATLPFSAQVSMHCIIEGMKDSQPSRPNLFSVGYFLCRKASNVTALMTSIQMDFLCSGVRSQAPGTSNLSLSQSNWKRSESFRYSNTPSSDNKISSPTIPNIHPA